MCNAYYFTGPKITLYSALPDLSNITGLTDIEGPRGGA